MVNFNELPDKVVFEILSHLDQDSFLTCAGVCKRWNSVIENNLDFFTNLFAEDYVEVLQTKASLLINQRNLEIHPQKSEN
jgi:hypothetical protein